MMDYFYAKPKDIRNRIGAQVFTGPTAGMCGGFGQAIFGFVL